MNIATERETIIKIIEISNTYLEYILLMTCLGSRTKKSVESQSSEKERKNEKCATYTFDDLESQVRKGCLIKRSSRQCGHPNAATYWSIMFENQ